MYLSFFPLSSSNYFFNNQTHTTNSLLKCKNNRKDMNTVTILIYKVFLN
nr:MAG TPA: hypothetical protein [Caudoviricetes sp.]